MLIIKLSSVDSTSVFLKQWVQQTKAHTAIGVWAEHQTHGVGRMGTTWYAEKGKNLTGSVYVGDISMPKEAVFEINKRVCLAVLDTLESENISNVKIKWPNDIVIENKKIGGILVEPILRGNRIIGVVVGCGININQLEFPKLPCATSLAKVTGKTYAVESLFEDLAKKIEQSIRTETTNDDRYLSVLYGVKESCFFEKKDGNHFTATVMGVAKDGRLILQYPDGSKEAFEEKKLVFTAFSDCR